jgi:hypothetical protein
VSGGVKIINNTGHGKDTVILNEETADRLVPGLLPVRKVTVELEAGLPVRCLLELDFTEVDIAGVSAFELYMRVPGTTEIAPVQEIRWKDGRVFKAR